MSDNKETLLEFPCSVPVKIFGRNQEGFELKVIEVVSRYFDESALLSIKEHDSRHGNYVAITATVYAEDYELLKALYFDLHQHPDVLMTL